MSDEQKFAPSGKDWRMFMTAKCIGNAFSSCPVDKAYEVTLAEFVDKLVADNASLRTELEAARADAKRLDWLGLRKRVDMGSAMGAPPISWWSISGERGSSIRESIDAALAPEGAARE